MYTLSNVHNENVQKISLEQLKINLILVIAIRISAIIIFTP